MSEHFDDLPEEAFLAALTALSHMTPHRLAGLLHERTAFDAWLGATGRLPSRVADGLWNASPELRDEWRRAPHPRMVWERCLLLGLTVLRHGRAGYPEPLRFDPSPPPVLFAKGDMAVVNSQRVGVVGTRNATDTGRRFAVHLGRSLARAGVAAVSGLARGIDVSVHRGMLEVSGADVGRPIAVVGSGHDQPFPRQNRHEWERVAADGLLLSEHPPGALPLAYRFPQRNRVIAGLSSVLVVVESRATGGSLITVREAMQRNRDVLAVPGSLLNRAAEGTNQLIADGAVPLLQPDDVLVALGLLQCAQQPFDTRIEPNADDRAVLAAFGVDTLAVDEVAERCDRPVLDVALAIGRLEAAGWVRCAGGWYQPITSVEALA